MSDIDEYPTRSHEYDCELNLMPKKKQKQSKASLLHKIIGSIIICAFIISVSIYWTNATQADDQMTKS